MSEERISELALRLREAAERLADPGLDSSGAAQLVDESARLAVEAAAELERAARAAGSDGDRPHPGQAELL